MSSPLSSAAPGKFSTSAGHADCSALPSGRHSPNSTAVARSRAAGIHRATPRHTTSAGGRTTGQQTWPTGSRCARSITIASTTTAGTSRCVITSRTSSHHPGSTPTESHGEEALSIWLVEHDAELLIACGSGSSRYGNADNGSRRNGITAPIHSSMASRCASCDPEISARRTQLPRPTNSVLA